MIATAMPGVRLCRPDRAPLLQLEHVGARSAGSERHLPSEPLARVMPPDENEVLVRLAVAERADERCELLRQIEPSTDPQVTYAISSLLERSQLSSVRGCAAQALALQSTPEAQSWLLDSSDDPIPEVRNSALQALAASEDSAVRAVVIESSLSENVELASSAVIALLKAEREEGVSAALKLLPNIEDGETLSELIRALGESRQPRALEVLLAIMDSAGPSARFDAITALGALGGPAATARLESLFEHGSLNEFRAAAKGWSRLAPEQCQLKLRSALVSDDVDRQVVALILLFGPDSGALIPFLQQQLFSENPAATQLLFSQLAKKPLPELRSEVARLGTLAQRSRNSALIRYGGATDTALDEQHPSLAELADDDSAEAQAELVRVIDDPTRNTQGLNYIVQVAPARTVQRIIDRSSTFSVELRRQLIHSLAELGSPQYSEALRAALRDADGVTRTAALEGLMRLGDEAALADARRMAQAGDPDERAAAVGLLALRLDSLSDAEIDSYASDSDISVVGSALNLMQRRPAEQILTAATRAFRRASPEDRATLQSNLTAFKSEVARPFNEFALREGDDTTAMQAIQALAGMQGPESAQRLWEVLRDSNRSHVVRSEAAAALRELGGPLARSNRALIDSLSKPNAEGFVCEGM
jgi:HEAT repeat protein